jgi:hypothetical protein
MAASSGSSGSGDAEKPTFSFEQLALRVAVAVLGLVLPVTAIELGNVRGRVGELETGGAPAPAAATQDPLGSPQSRRPGRQRQAGPQRHSPGRLAGL